MKIRNVTELKPIFRSLYDTAKILLDNGKEVVAEVSEFKPKRTNAQNSYYFLLNNEVANFLNDSGLTYGEFNLPYNKDIIHEIQKKVFGIETTTKMTVKEFCDYETQVIHFWQERTHGEWQPSETPEIYLIRKGYDLEYNLR